MRDFTPWHLKRKTNDAGIHGDCTFSRFSGWMWCVGVEMKSTRKRMICLEMQLFHHFCSAHAVQQILKFLNNLGGNPVLRIGVCARLPFRLLRQHQRKLSMLALTLKIRLCHVTGHHGYCGSWDLHNPLVNKEGCQLSEKAMNALALLYTFSQQRDMHRPWKWDHPLTIEVETCTFKTPTLVCQNYQNHIPSVWKEAF